MPYGHVPSSETYFEWSGLPTGPVLVLSNSLGTDLALWEPQRDALGRRFRVLRYDTRGHGRSAVPEGPYRLDQLGGDVLALLDAEGVEQASFCGISLGGMTALWLGLHAPERITAIVAANTAARIGNKSGWEERMAQVRQDGMLSLVEGTLGRWFTASFRQRHPEAAAAVGTTLRTVSEAGYLGCCAAIRDTDLMELVQDIRVPALILAGKYDPVTPPSDAQFLHAAIPGSSLRELEASHLSNIEDADGFNEAVVQFLDEVGARQRKDRDDG